MCLFWNLSAATMEANCSNITKLNGFLNHTVKQDCNLPHYCTYMGLIFVILFIAVGFVGNSTVILVLVRAKHNLAASTLNYVISVALSDLLTCLTVMPFDIVYWLDFPKWSLSPEMCKLWNALFYTFHASGSLGITAISLDTYSTVSAPLHHHENKINLYSKVAIGLIWSWSFSVGALIYVFQERPPVGSYLFEINSIAYASYLLVHLLVPQVIAAGCYFRLFRIAKLHAVSIRSLNVFALSTGSVKSSTSQRLSFKEEFKLARTFLFVTVGYFVCWNPFLAVQFVYVFNKESKVNWCSLEIADTVLCWLAYFQCCLNPFLYALRKKYFQELFRRAIGPR